MLICKKTLMFFILLGASLSHAKSLLDEMVDEMNEVQARFERRFNKLNEDLKKGSLAYNLTTETASISIAENKTTSMVDIIISPLAISQAIVDARVDQDANTLQVTTPAGNAVIHTDRHMICVNFNHQLKHEQASVNGKGKQQVIMSSYSQSAKTVSAEMNLEEAHIEYDQATQKLTISIPLRKKNSIRIPVNFKEKTEPK